MVGVGRNFGVGGVGPQNWHGSKFWHRSKKWHEGATAPLPQFLKVPFSINIYVYTIFVKFLLYEHLLIHGGGVIILTQSQTPLM